MIKIRTRPGRVFSAEQCWPNLAVLPAGVKLYDDGFYRCDGHIVTQGDWILRHEHHSAIVIDSVLFELLFEPVSEDDD